MIDKLYQEWLSLQPLKEEYRYRLDQKLMLEFNYNSNHIEGNTLTYGQTELLLMFGKVVEEAKMKDLEEMKAHNVALKMIQTEASDKQKPLTENFIRTLHHTLLREDYVVYRKSADGMSNSYTVHAGCYKTRPNSVITVTGERFEYASPEETPALMNDLVTWYNQAVCDGGLSPIELATVFHYRYIRIHPFEDGNGRIARLLVNYILFHYDYPMIVVRSKDKERYLSALNRCDVAVGTIPSVGAHAELAQLTPFVDYMRACLEHSLRLCIKAAKGEDIEEEDDFEKKIKILEKQRQNRNPVKLNLDELNRLRSRFKELVVLIKEKISSLNKFYYNVDCDFFVVSEPDLNALEVPYKQAQIICSCFNSNKNLLPHDSRLQYEINIQFNESSYDIPLLDKTYKYGMDVTRQDQAMLIRLVREALLQQLEDSMKINN